MTRGGGEGEAAVAANELVFAVCHEIGNLLAGVRLDSVLLEPAAAAEELAKAGERIETASARAGSLLALVRPLLVPEAMSLRSADPMDVLDGLFSGLDSASEGRVQIELKSAANLPRVRLVPDVVHHLMLSVIFCGLEAGGAASRMRVWASADGEDVAFSLLDEVREPDDEALALCGRPLVLAIADRLLQPLAGCCEAAVGASGTRVSFRLPAAPD